MVDIPGDGQLEGLRSVNDVAGGDDAGDKEARIAQLKAMTAEIAKDADHTAAIIEAADPEDDELDWVEEEAK